MQYEESVRVVISAAMVRAYQTGNDPAIAAEEALLIFKEIMEREYKILNDAFWKRMAVPIF